MSAAALIIGLAILVGAWAGPLPERVPGSFAAHMTLHMTVTGIAAPLIAAGLAPRVSNWRVLARPGAIALTVTLLDLAVIWAWHAPALHRAARARPDILALEQASFVLVAVAVWTVALAAPAGRHAEAALAGAMTLFFTSMHMTLLGALLALAPQPLFGHAHGIGDQHLGGAIMLMVGAVVYLAGGLFVASRVLRGEAA
jgi:putative membrane protein